MLLSMNSSEEGRGTWLPDPEASVSSPPPLILISATLRPGLCACVHVCVCVRASTRGWRRALSCVGPSSVGSPPHPPCIGTRQSAGTGAQLVAPPGASEECGSDPGRLGKDPRGGEKAGVGSRGPSASAVMHSAFSSSSRMTRSTWALRPSPIKSTGSL